jgi:hypothetical protein
MVDNTTTTEIVNREYKEYQRPATGILNDDIGRINSALYLGRVKGREQRGPEPLGVSNKG